MFPTFDIVKELCKKQGISINTLEEKIGFSKILYILGKIANLNQVNWMLLPIISVSLLITS